MNNRRTLFASIGLAALAASLPAAAENYYFRAKHTLIAAVAPLSLVHAAGPSALIDEGDPWDLRFSAAGGKGPYSFALASPQATGMANVSGTQEGGTYALTGTAAAGTYALSVEVTDATGAKASAALDVMVRPVVLAATVERPVSLSGQADRRRIHDEQPDWHILYDGSTVSSVPYSTSEADWARLTFARAVTFDKVYVDSDARYYVKVRLADGSWVDASNYVSTRGVVQLNQTYTATQVALWGVGRVSEFRVGGGDAAPFPSAKASTARTVPVSQDLITSAMFEAKSPYAPGAVSLAKTPTSQNGVTLDVSADRIRIVSRPVHDTDVAIAAETKDGLLARIIFRVEGTAGADHAVKRPSSLRHANGNLVKAFGEQADWNVLYDGSTFSAQSFSTPEADWVGLRFDTPATIDRVYVDADARYYVKVRLPDGTWTDGTDYISTKGTVQLKRAYTTSEIALWGVGRVSEFRAGGGTPALPPAPKSTASRSLVAGSVITSAMFETRSPYDPGAISLAETPASQNGVTLDVSATGVRVASRPAQTAEVAIVASTTDGLRSWTLFTVEGATGATATVERPSSLRHANGNLVRAYGEQPDWNVLYDGSAATGQSFSTPEADWVGLKFARPATFDRVYVDADARYYVKVRLPDGTWSDATDYISTKGTVQLKRTYTTSEVALWGVGRVTEFRAGGGGVASAAAPKSTLSRTLAAGGEVSSGDFETRSPYLPGAVSLAETPASQNGVILDVSSDRVRVISGPANNTQVAIVASTPDGLKSWNMFTVQAPGGGAATPTVENPVSLRQTSTGITRAYVGQPDWHVLYDGSTSSSQAFSTPENQWAGVKFARPVTFDRVYVDADARYYVKVRLSDGTWTDATDYISTKGTVQLNRAYTATEVAVWGVGRLYELRIGAGAAVPAP